MDVEIKLDVILNQLEQLENMRAAIDVIIRQQVQFETKLDKCLNKQDELLKILSEHSILLGRNVVNISSASSRFPLKCEEDLEILEEELTGENQENLVMSLRRLLNNDLARNLERIFDPNLLSQYNYDGTKGKKALKIYSSLIMALKGLLIHPNNTLSEIQHRNRHVCSVCGRSYLRKGHLKRHVTFECIGVAPRFWCEYCSSRYRRKEELNRHVLSAHKIDLRRYTKSGTKKTHKARENIGNDEYPVSIYYNNSNSCPEPVLPQHSINQLPFDFHQQQSQQQQHQQQQQHYPDPLSEPHFDDGAYFLDG